MHTALLPTGQPDKPPNRFVPLSRRIYYPLGFKKGYDYTLCKKNSLQMSQSI